MIYVGSVYIRKKNKSRGHERENKIDAGNQWRYFYSGL